MGLWRTDARFESLEHHMYMGGGILGTILIILLIVWLVRRV
jgi:flagellar biogenesis protein FliO